MEEEKIKDEQEVEQESTKSKETEEVDDDKLMGILAYLFILVIIPLVARKNSKFIRFHTNQGLILLIIEVFAVAVCNILSIIPYVGLVFSILGYLIDLACVALAIIGIVNVCNKEEKELPVVGKFKILK